MELIGEGLEGLVKPLNLSQRLYIYGLVDGLSETEAHKLVKAYGVDIDRYLMELDFREVVEKIKGEGTKYKEEGRILLQKDTEWLAKCFRLKAISKGIGELEKGMKKRDKVLLQIAATCSNNEGGGKGKKAMGESYDELVLRKHRALK